MQLDKAFLPYLIIRFILLKQNLISQSLVVFLY
jgi:hypothetical protein